MNRPSTRRDGWADDVPAGNGVRADTELLAKRLRSGASVVLVASLVFAGVDLALSRDAAAALMTVKAVQCTVLVGFLMLLSRARDAESLRRLGATALGLVYVTTTISGLLRGQVGASTFLVFMTVMATASFVPWGARAQLTSASIAGLAMAGGILVEGEPLGRETVYLSLTIAIVLFGSVWVAAEQERQRRDRRHAEREVAAASQVSAALARAGEEMIRSESGPGILDTLCRLVAELLHAERTALVLYDASENAFAVHSAYGDQSPEWELIRGVNVSARAIRHLLAGLNADGVVQTETRSIKAPMVRELLERDGVAVSLYVPLRHSGEIIGIISAHDRDPARRFSPAEERIAIGVAHLAAMALHNTRLVDELREANRLKSDFVSTMSHELRTPVSVILGYTEMIADDPDRRDRTDILRSIRRSGLELLDLVEETLNLSRLEAGQDPPRFEPVAVPELFAELVGEFRAMTSLDDVAVRWDGPESLLIRSDPRKLRMILKNLIGNALKFTGRGEVVLECASHDGVVLFVVRDTGIGIAPQHLPIIFDMFRQADSSDARSYRGAGLGLYIVQRLVHQLGGEIHVSSELGRGSSFTFTLPSAGDEARVAAVPQGARAAS